MKSFRKVLSFLTVLFMMFTFPLAEAFALTDDPVTVVGVSAGWVHTACLDSAGKVYLTTSKTYGHPEVDDWGKIVQVAIGQLHVLGLKEDGTVAAAGHNEDGQCRVSDLSNIVQIDAGTKHSVFLRNDGTVAVRGKTADGRADTAKWENIVYIAAGASHTLGVTESGTVLAVGHNAYGQCNVSNWTDIISVSGGAFHSVGLRRDGNAVATGSNQYGQCNVTGWTDIIAVSAGDNHTLGLKADGTVVAVGDNSHGQCSTEQWADVIAVSAGGEHSVALTSDGRVLTTGNNKEGQCTLPLVPALKEPAGSAESESAPVVSGSGEYAVYQHLLETEYRDTPLNVRYSIWDMNRDGQAEFIVSTRTCDADHTATVYTVENGAAVKIGEFSLSNASLYGDISGVGLLAFDGYMRGYVINLLTYDGAAELHTEEILSGRLEEDEINYPEITNFYPGARQLAFADISNSLLMEEYRSIPAYLNGDFPVPQSERYPNDDPNVFMNTVLNNLPVSWTWVGFGGEAETVPFQTLLEEGFLSYEELAVSMMQTVDLNGDGTVDCVLELSEPDSPFCNARIYLAEQDGKMHAYVAAFEIAGDFDLYSYVWGNMTVAGGGNLLLTSKFDFFPEERCLIRLIFDGNESFIQELPMQYYYLA